MLWVHAQRGKIMWGHNQKVAVHKPGRELSPETDPDSTLILDLQPPELWDRKLLLFSPFSLSYFVMAAQADEYTFT